MRFLSKRLIRLSIFRAAAAFVLAALLVQDCAWAGASSVSGPALTAAPAVPPLNTVILDPGLLPIPAGCVLPRAYAPGANGRLIIHVQDAHGNYTAQKNLAKAIGYWMDRYPAARLVAVEGGEGDGSLAKIRESAPEALLRRAAEQMLRDGLVTGEEYLNLTSDHLMEILGVEDQALYDRDRAVYAGIAARRPLLMPALGRMRSAVQALKARVYPQAALDYETVCAASSDWSFAARSEAMKRLPPEARPDLTRYPTWKRWEALRARDARTESAALAADMDRLAAALPADDPSLAPLRSGQLQDPAAAAAAWDGIARAAEAATRGAVRAGEALASYLKSLREAAALDVDALSRESDRMDAEVFAKLLQDPVAARLRALDRHLGFLDRAVQLRLEAGQAAELGAGMRAFPSRHALAWLNRQLAERSLESFWVPYDPNVDAALRRIRNFYDLAVRRDAEFVGRLDTAMSERGDRAAFLIAGGYHSARVLKLLNDRGYSVIVLAPVTDHETDWQAYERVLLGTGLPRRAGSAPGLSGWLRQPMASQTLASRLAAWTGRPVYREIAPYVTVAGPEARAASGSRPFAGVKPARADGARMSVGRGPFDRYVYRPYLRLLDAIGDAAASLRARVRGWISDREAGVIIDPDQVYPLFEPSVWKSVWRGLDRGGRLRPSSETDRPASFKALVLPETEPSSAPGPGVWPTTFSLNLDKMNRMLPSHGTMAESLAAKRGLPFMPDHIRVEANSVPSVTVGTGRRSRAVVATVLPGAARSTQSVYWKDRERFHEDFGTVVRAMASGLPQGLAPSVYIDVDALKPEFLEEFAGQIGRPLALRYPWQPRDESKRVYRLTDLAGYMARRRPLSSLARTIAPVTDPAMIGYAQPSFAGREAVAVWTRLFGAAAGKMSEFALGGPDAYLRLRTLTPVTLISGTLAVPEGPRRVHRVDIDHPEAGRGLFYVKTQLGPNVQDLVRREFEFYQRAASVRPALAPEARLFQASKDEFFMAIRDAGGTDFDSGEIGRWAAEVRDARDPDARARAMEPALDFVRAFAEALARLHWEAGIAHQDLLFPGRNSNLVYEASRPLPSERLRFIDFHVSESLRDADPGRADALRDSEKRDAVAHMRLIIENVLGASDGGAASNPLYQAIPGEFNRVYDETRTRAVEAAGARLPGLMDRIVWEAESFQEPRIDMKRIAIAQDLEPVLRDLLAREKAEDLRAPVRMAILKRLAYSRAFIVKVTVGKKSFVARLAAEPRFNGSVENYAKIAARLEGAAPGQVPEVIARGRIGDGREYVVTDFLPATPAMSGSPLGTMTFSERVRFFAELLTLLGKVHDRGVRVVDIAARNIGVLADGRPALYDFDLSIGPDYDWRSDALHIRSDFFSSYLPTNLAEQAEEKYRPNPSTDLHMAGVFAEELFAADELKRAPDVRAVIRRLSGWKGDREPELPQPRPSGYRSGQQAASDLRKIMERERWSDLERADRRIAAHARRMRAAGDEALLSIVVPMHNERQRMQAADRGGEDFLRAKIAQAADAFGAQAGVIDWELVLVDDGSTDGSAAAAERIFEEYPDKLQEGSLRVVRITPDEKRRLGSVKGGAVRAGTRSVLRQDGREADWVLVTDADVSADLRWAAPFVAEALDRRERGEREFYLKGSRKSHGGRALGRPWLSRVRSAVFSGVVRWALPELRSVPDTQAGFDFLSAAAAERILDATERDGRTPDRGLTFRLEWLLAAKDEGIEPLSMGIVWKDSAAQSKMSLRQSWTMFAEVLQKRVRRPDRGLGPGSGPTRTGAPTASGARLTVEAALDRLERRIRSYQMVSRLARALVDLEDHGGDLEPDADSRRSEMNQNMGRARVRNFLALEDPAAPEVIRILAERGIRPDGSLVPDESVFPEMARHIEFTQLIKAGRDLELYARSMPLRSEVADSLAEVSDRLIRQSPGERAAFSAGPARDRLSKAFILVTELYSDKTSEMRRAVRANLSVRELDDLLRDLESLRSAFSALWDVLVSGWLRSGASVPSEVREARDLMDLANRRWKVIQEGLDRMFRRAIESAESLLDPRQSELLPSGDPAPDAWDGVDDPEAFEGAVESVRNELELRERIQTQMAFERSQWFRHEKALDGWIEAMGREDDTVAGLRIEFEAAHAMLTAGDGHLDSDWVRFSRALDLLGDTPRLRSEIRSAVTAADLVSRRPSEAFAGLADRYPTAAAEPFLAPVLTALQFVYQRRASLETAAGRRRLIPVLGLETPGEITRVSNRPGLDRTVLESWLDAYRIQGMRQLADIVRARARWMHLVHRASARPSPEADAALIADTRLFVQKNMNLNDGVYSPIAGDLNLALFGRKDGPETAARIREAILQTSGEPSVRRHMKRSGVWLRQEIRRIRESAKRSRNIVMSPGVWTQGAHPEEPGQVRMSVLYANRLLDVIQSAAVMTRVAVEIGRQDEAEEWLAASSRTWPAVLLAAASIEPGIRIGEAGGERHARSLLAKLVRQERLMSAVWDRKSSRPGRDRGETVRKTNQMRASVSRNLVWPALLLSLEHETDGDTRRILVSAMEAAREIRAQIERPLVRSGQAAPEIREHARHVLQAMIAHEERKMSGGLIVSVADPAEKQTPLDLALEARALSGDSLRKTLEKYESSGGMTPIHHEPEMIRWIVLSLALAEDRINAPQQGARMGVERAFPEKVADLTVRDEAYQVRMSGRFDAEGLDPEAISSFREVESLGVLEFGPRFKQIVDKGRVYALVHSGSGRVRAFLAGDAVTKTKRFNFYYVLVAPAFRRNGDRLGASLLRAVGDHLRSEGFEQARWLAVRGSAPFYFKFLDRARALYTYSRNGEEILDGTSQEFRFEWTLTPPAITLPEVPAGSKRYALPVTTAGLNAEDARRALLSRGIRITGEDVRRMGGFRNPEHFMAFDRTPLKNGETSDWILLDLPAADGYPDHRGWTDADVDRALERISDPDEHPSSAWMPKWLRGLSVPAIRESRSLKPYLAVAVIRPRSGEAALVWPTSASEQRLETAANVPEIGLGEEDAYRRQELAREMSADVRTNLETLIDWLMKEPDPAVQQEIYLGISAYGAAAESALVRRASDPSDADAAAKAVRLLERLKRGGAFRTVYEQWSRAAREIRAEEYYHQRASEIFGPAHAAYASFLDRMQGVELDPLTLPGAGEVTGPNPDAAFKPSDWNWDKSGWMGRSLVTPSVSGRGGLVLKALSPQEGIGNAQTEAELLNALYPGTARARVVRAADMSEKGVPGLSDPDVWILAYEVADREKFFTYPSGFSAAGIKELAASAAGHITAARRLESLGWGYVGWLGLFHDIQSERRYDLGARPAGAIEDLEEALRYANARAEGVLADLSPDHMIWLGTQPRRSAGTDGPVDAEKFARSLRDRIFQLAILYLWVGIKKGAVRGPEDTSKLLETIADDTMVSYGLDTDGVSWRHLLPLPAADLAREADFAFRHPQTSFYKKGFDLGFDNGPLSAPSLVAYAEAVSRAATLGLLNRASGARMARGWNLTRSVPGTVARLALEVEAAEKRAAVGERIERLVRKWMDNDPLSSPSFWIAVLGYAAVILGSKTWIDLSRGWIEAYGWSPEQGSSASIGHMGLTFIVPLMLWVGHSILLLWAFAPTDPNEEILMKDLERLGSAVRRLDQWTRGGLLKEGSKDQEFVGRLADDALEISRTIRIGSDLARKVIPRIRRTVGQAVRRVEGPGGVWTVIDGTSRGALAMGEARLTVIAPERFRREYEPFVLNQESDLYPLRQALRRFGGDPVRIASLTGTEAVHVGGYADRVRPAQMPTADAVEALVSGSAGARMSHRGLSAAVALIESRLGGLKSWEREAYIKIWRARYGFLGAKLILGTLRALMIGGLLFLASDPRNLTLSRLFWYPLTLLASGFMAWHVLGSVVFAVHFVRGIRADAAWTHPDRQRFTRVASALERLDRQSSEGSLEPERRYRLLSLAEWVLRKAAEMSSDQPAVSGRILNSVRVLGAWNDHPMVALSAGDETRIIWSGRGGLGGSVRSSYRISNGRDLKAFLDDLLAEYAIDGSATIEGGEAEGADPSVTVRAFGDAWDSIASYPSIVKTLERILEPVSEQRRQAFMKDLAEGLRALDDGAAPAGARMASPRPFPLRYRMPAADPKLVASLLDRIRVFNRLSPAGEAGDGSEAEGLAILSKIFTDRFGEELDAPLNPYERELFEFFAAHPEIPFHFHLGTYRDNEANLSVYRDGQNVWTGLAVGYWIPGEERVSFIEASSETTLRSQYELLLHEMSHVRDGALEVRSIDDRVRRGRLDPQRVHAPYTQYLGPGRGFEGGTPNYTRLAYREFRANLWAYAGDYRKAFDTTQQTYGNQMLWIVGPLLEADPNYPRDEIYLTLKKMSETRSKSGYFRIHDPKHVAMLWRTAAAVRKELGRPALPTPSAGARMAKVHARPFDVPSVMRRTFDPRSRAGGWILPDGRSAVLGGPLWSEPGRSAYDVFRLDDGQLRSRFETESPILGWDPAGGFLTASAGEVRFHRASDAVLTETVRIPAAAAAGAAVLDARRLAVLEDTGRTLWIIDRSTGEVLRAIPTGGGTVRGVVPIAYSPARDMMAVGFFHDVKLFELGQTAADASADGMPRVRPLELREWTDEPVSSRVLSADFSSDGKWLAVGSEDGLVHLWNVERRQLAAFIQEAAAPVYSVRFSADGTLAALWTDSDAGNTALRAWKLEDLVRLGARMASENGSALLMPVQAADQPEVRILTAAAEGGAAVVRVLDGSMHTVILEVEFEGRRYFVKAAQDRPWWLRLFDRLTGSARWNAPHREDLFLRRLSDPERGYRSAALLPRRVAGGTAELPFMTAEKLKKSYGIRPDLGYLITEKADGDPILLVDLSAAEMSQTLSRVAEALRTMNEEGVAHGDLKPQEIHVSQGARGWEDAKVVFTDWELGTVDGDADLSVSMLSRYGLERAHNLLNVVRPLERDSLNTAETHTDRHQKDLRSLRGVAMDAFLMFDHISTDDTDVLEPGRVDGPDSVVRFESDLAQMNALSQDLQVAVPPIAAARMSLSDGAALKRLRLGDVPDGPTKVFLGTLVGESLADKVILFGGAALDLALDQPTGNPSDLDVTFVSRTDYNDALRSGVIAEGGDDKIAWTRSEPVSGVKTDVLDPAVFKLLMTRRPELTVDKLTVRLAATGADAEDPMIEVREAVPGAYEDLLNSKARWSGDTSQAYLIWRVLPRIIKKMVRYRLKPDDQALRVIDRALEYGLDPVRSGEHMSLATGETMTPEEFAAQTRAAAQALRIYLDNLQGYGPSATAKLTHLSAALDAAGARISESSPSGMFKVTLDALSHQPERMVGEISRRFEGGEKVILSSASQEYEVEKIVDSTGIGRTAWILREVSPDGSVGERSFLKWTDPTMIMFGVPDPYAGIFTLKQMRDDAKARLMVSGLVDENKRIGGNDGLANFAHTRYVDGVLLSDIKDPERRLRIIRRLTENLDYLNRTYGFVHGDVHGRNIIVDGSDRPMLTDFDMTRVVSRLDAEAGIRRPFEYQDIYDIGAQILLTFKAGRPKSPDIFTGDDLRDQPAIDIRDWRGKTEIPDLDRIPTGLRQIVRKAMLGDSAAHYETIADLRRDLDSYFVSVARLSSEKVGPEEDPSVPVIVEQLGEHLPAKTLTAHVGAREISARWRMSRTATAWSLELIDRSAPGALKADSSVLLVGGTLQELKEVRRRYPESQVAIVNTDRPELEAVVRAYATDADRPQGPLPQLYLADASHWSARIEGAGRFDLVYAGGLDPTAFAVNQSAVGTLSDMIANELEWVREGGIIYHPADRFWKSWVDAGIARPILAGETGKEAGTGIFVKVSSAARMAYRPFSDLDAVSAGPMAVGMEKALAAGMTRRAVPVQLKGDEVYTLVPVGARMSVSDGSGAAVSAERETAVIGMRRKPVDVAREIRDKVEAIRRSLEASGLMPAPGTAPADLERFAEVEVVLTLKPDASIGGTRTDAETRQWREATREALQALRERMKDLHVLVAVDPRHSDPELLKDLKGAFDPSPEISRAEADSGHRRIHVRTPDMRGNRDTLNFYMESDRYRDGEFQAAPLEGTILVAAGIVRAQIDRSLTESGAIERVTSAWQMLSLSRLESLTAYTIVIGVASPEANAAHAAKAVSIGQRFADLIQVLAIGARMTEIAA